MHSLSTNLILSSVFGRMAVLFLETWSVSYHHYNSDLTKYAPRVVMVSWLVVVWYRGALLQAWINCNSSIDAWFHPLWYVGWNYVSIPKLQRLQLLMPGLKLLNNVSKGGPSDFLKISQEIELGNLGNWHTWIRFVNIVQVKQYARILTIMWTTFGTDHNN